MKCTECRKPMRKTKGTYRYRECGLDNVYLKGIPIYECPEGHKEPVISKPVLIHDRVARELIKKSRVLGGPEIRFLRKQMGLSSTLLANLMGVTLTTVSRWENGDAPIGSGGDRLLRLLYVRHVEKEKGKVVYRNFPDVLLGSPPLPQKSVINIEPSHLRALSYAAV